MAVSHVPVTAEELLETPNDGLRRELVGGVVPGWRLPVADVFR